MALRIENIVSENRVTSISNLHSLYKFCKGLKSRDVANWAHYQPDALLVLKHSQFDVLMEQERVLAFSGVKANHKEFPGVCCFLASAYVDAQALPEYTAKDLLIKLMEWQWNHVPAEVSLAFVPW